MVAALDASPGALALGQAFKFLAAANKKEAILVSVLGRTS